MICPLLTKHVLLVFQYKVIGYLSIKCTHSLINVETWCLPIHYLLHCRIPDWSEAIEVAVRDVLPSGAMSNPTDSSTICKDLPAYAAAFVVLLEQKNDIESLEGLALAFRKRGAKQGCRSLHSLSPMRTLANRVCQSAMNLIEHKLIVAREDYLKRSFITEAHQQLLSKVEAKNNIRLPHENSNNSLALFSSVLR